MTVVRMALALLLAVMTASGTMAGEHVSTVLPSGIEELWEGGDRCGEPTVEQWALTLEMDYRTAAQVAGEAKVIPYRFIVEDLVAAVQAQVADGARPGGADPRQRSTTGKAGTGTSANIFGFTGHEMDPETGLVYMKGRYYDPEIGRFLTEDPAIGDLSVPPSLHKYLYGNANPTFYVDPDGRAAESIWDAFSLGVGLASLGYNLYHGNLRDAGVDTLGVLADSAALALPFVPGGAGATIRTSRAGTATAQQLNRARQLTRGVDTVQTIDQAVNVVDSTARAREALDEGSFAEAAFNAGVAALGARGTLANTNAARSGRHYDDIPNPRGPPSGAADRGYDTTPGAGSGSPILLTESKSRVGVNSEALITRSGTRSVDPPYDPRNAYRELETRYPGQVSSSTMARENLSNVRLAGQRHPRTGIVFDARGFPIFDDVSAFETRIAREVAEVRRRGVHFSAANESLREALARGQVDPTMFSAGQLQAIQEGAEKVPGFTWHHHQDFGRLQLVPEGIHKATGHVGGIRVWFQ